MEKRAGGDLGSREGKCNMEKKCIDRGGSICKCALQVNDFCMKVWNFTSPHPTPNTPESRLLGVSARGALGGRHLRLVSSLRAVGSWSPKRTKGATATQPHATPVPIC